MKTRKSVITAVENDRLGIEKFFDFSPDHGVAEKSGKSFFYRYIIIF
jgi:hypothetical protein